MSHAAAAEQVADRFETPLTPESWGKLGMWVFLAGDAMSFGGLLAAYGALRLLNSARAVGDKLLWPNPMQHLGINMTAGMTFLLICSSVTMVKALSASRRRDLGKTKLFLALTILGGLIFLGCQAVEWTHLMGEEHMRFTSNPWGTALFGSTFFTLTGFHGMHVLSGVIYLTTILLGVIARGRANPDKIEILGLYWHFVDLIWILVFTFVYLI